MASAVINFLRKVLRVHIHSKSLNYSDVQKPSCKIWHVIIRTPYETRCGGGGWLELAEDRVQWQDFVNMAMGLQVP
jgi:hypothetical protein